MAKDLRFRTLRPDEIELRVGATNETGFSLLLYKTARVDANILDETVGAFNWQKKFYQVKNTMICSLGINMNYDEPNKEPYWVWKDDAGDESNTEAVKGEASDSFKRAGFAFGGLGRELYTSPFIWIKKNEDNNPKTSHYSVSKIEYKDKVIIDLVITNDKTGAVVYSMRKNSNTNANEKKPQAVMSEEENAPIRKEDKEFLQNYVGALDEETYNKFFDWMFKKFNTRSIGGLTAAQGIVAVNLLKNNRR